MSTYYIPPYAGIYDVQNISFFSPYSRSGPHHWLPQVSLSSVTKLYDTASRTRLSQTFVNPSNVSPITSAKYTFPLYESCVIVSFRCYVGTRVIEGIIKEKQEASTTYQAAVEQLEPASLLEQQTPDVFSTSLGNIPPGETVAVEIEYIMELKHDAEVDGLRFTIPTCIAPRYGDPPSGLSADAASTGVTMEGMSISVEVSMSSNIKSVQSPSHPISVHLGGHTEDTPDHVFNPQQALATLGQTSTELGKDFILLIKCASLSSPTALLETHPTIPNSKALMLTLVPKFKLPESSKPEVVFIVDRSGSMSSRVAPLKSSLSVFLKSLPLDVNFNICSFGSSYSFLWEQSQPYSNRSFAEAQRHCDSMEADFGGTEILPPIRSTIARRFKDLNLEIMVLTDGEVWNSEALFEYVEKETAKGDVRLFSLGIGRDVSHALIDGIARVGRGFSQVVSDEREGMENKVAHMLRGGLSAHVLNYRLEWEGKPSEEDAIPQRRLSISRAVRRISLFDAHANTGSPISFSDPDPPDFIVPSVLQAPYKLQPLFPFSRSSAYVLFSDDARPPSHVWLRGTTPAGDELELEIVVQKVPGKEETVHQLAARKILQELKDGTGYLHGGRRGASRARQPAVFAEWVKREGVRVGLKYRVASHWTSFVAVVRKEDDVEEVLVDNESLSGLDDDEVYEFVDGNDDNDDDGAGDAGANSSPLGGSAARPSTTRPHAPQPVGSVPVMMMMTPPPPPIPYPTKSSMSSKPFSHSLKGKSALNKGADSKLSPYSKLPSEYSAPQSTPPSTTSPASLKSIGPMLPAKKSKQADSYFNSFAMPQSFSGEDYEEDCDDQAFLAADSKFTSRPTLSKPHDNKWWSKGSKFGTPDIAIAYSPSSAPPAERLASESGAQPLSLRTKALIDLQTFEGCFVLDPALATLLGVSITDLEAQLSCFTPSNAGLSQEHKRSVWATMLAIKFFETQLAGERSVWQLVVDKAKAWLDESAIVGDADVKELERLVGEVLGV